MYFISETQAPRFWCRCHVRVSLLSLVSCFLVWTEAAGFPQPKKQTHEQLCGKIKVTTSNSPKYTSFWHFGHLGILLQPCVGAQQQKRREERGGILCVHLFALTTTPRCAEVQMCAPSCIYSAEERGRGLCCGDCSALKLSLSSHQLSATNCSLLTMS